MNKPVTNICLSAITVLSIAGCNGGGGDAGTSNPQGQEQITTPTTQSYSLKGVAAVGAALQNGTVKIVDADGKQYTATIDPVSGIFQVLALQASACAACTSSGWHRCWPNSDTSLCHRRNT